MDKKIFITGVMALVMGNSLMAMTAFNQQTFNLKEYIPSIGVEKVKIRNSGFKSTTAVSLKFEKSRPGSFGWETATGTQISYGKLKYEEKGGNTSYLKIAAYKQIGKNLAKIGKGNIRVYTGLKTQIDLIGGLNNKGIGIGPYVGVKYKINKFNVGANLGVSRDWFEGGKFFTETSAGADVSFRF